MAMAAAKGMEARLSSLRGRLATTRALEDLQWGLAAGAAVAVVLGALRFLTLLPASPLQACGTAACVALAFPAAGVLLRRTSNRRVANLVDERLGLAERVGTALALRTGEAADTPLSSLVLEDAERSMAAVPAASLRRAFRPRLFPRPLVAAAGAALLALFAFRADPMEPGRAPKALAAAYREKKEREDSAKAARKVLEEARTAEETADAKHMALRAAAAEMRREAEEMLRQNPPKAEAMAKFQKMGEMVRERQEMLAGVDPQKLKEFKASGETSKLDPDLQKLLAKLLDADMKGLNDRLSSLDRDLKGGEGASEWSEESLASLKAEVDRLADELAKGAGALGDRPGLKGSLGVLGNQELLREISKRLQKLMETLQKQGWKPCQNPNGLNKDGMGECPAGEPIHLTDAQLQAMIEKLKELQELADLGELSFGT